MHRRLGLLWTVVVATAFRGELALPARPAEIRGTPAGVYADPAMHMPTDVAVGPDGTVYIADGVGQRVARFAPDGSPLEAWTRFDEIALEDPIGLSVGPEGNLWIADAGRGQILRVRPDGHLLEALTPPAVGGRRADLTGVAVSADGSSVWACDNDGQRLLRFVPHLRRWQAIGQEGRSLGQFRYPFLLDCGPEGRVYVVETVNTRVQVFSGDGRPSRGIGTYGVEPGQLYRPKGIATDEDGDLWVSDGVLGVVQVFRRDGGFLGVLRDADGRPLHFAHPMGLAFDGEGNLYVAELEANRVRKVVLQIERSLLRVRPVQPRTSDEPTASPACTVCHLDWIPPFRDGQDSPLMRAPLSLPEQPVASREQTCLSCHDGSVVDSRHRVWAEHSHRTGIKPPPTMRVPPNLPLVNGRLACRTCHSAHAGGPPTGDIAKAVFLRVPNPSSELCMSCHADKLAGPAGGTHPVGGMPWAVPEALIRAGAKPGVNPRELTCQVCHNPHGARHEHLLVMGTDVNQLCRTCHDQMRPGMFLPQQGRHPLRPKVNDVQRAAIERMGTDIGRDGRLICLSCHRLHGARSRDFLLARPLRGGDMCLACHPGRRSVLETAHDLRTHCPQERNRLGMTAETGGPCSACHLFHNYARTPEPGPVDRLGLCVTCHAQGRCAAGKTLGPINHPSEAACIDCHDPHSRQFGPFLADRPARLCQRCHKDQARLAGSPHDYRRDPTKWPEVSRKTGGGCLVCHRPHGDEQTGLMRGGIAQAQAREDGACLACHEQARWNADGAMAARHPRDISRLHAVLGLPLVRLDGEDAIGCMTCHDPHAPPAGDSPLLRTTGVDGPVSMQVCLTCHREQQALTASAHAPQTLAGHALTASACRPCHTLHAPPGGVAGHLMPAKLRGPAPEQTADRMDTSDPACTGCHRPGGVAPVPLVAWHPQVAMQDPLAGSPRDRLALFDEAGRPAARGRITCRTCHKPHGRKLPAGVLATDGQELRRWSMLRAFEPPNLCTSCHGADGLRRFLYFHDPARRGGPLATAGGP